MSLPSHEQVFEVARGPVAAEIRHILDVLSPDHLTASELVALLTVLRPPYDRLTYREACPPVPLSLVPR